MLKQKLSTWNSK